VDLHMHSVCSDGERSPGELVELAARKGLTHIAITDHDTVSAYSELDRMEVDGVELISGLEFNTTGPNGEIHILGYGIDLENEQIVSYCNWRQEERKRWSREIVKKLRSLSYVLDWEDCIARAGGGVIVRTHIADELVGKGYFRTSQEAFDSLLRMGRPAFIERAQFTTKEAIDLIHHAGGLAFIAHPGIYSFEWSLDVLVQEGIDGIEAFYAKHAPVQTDYWAEQAKSRGLLVSVGSDFHGETSRNPMMIGSVDYKSELVHPWVEDLIRKGIGVT